MAPECILGFLGNMKYMDQEFEYMFNLATNLCKEHNNLNYSCSNNICIVLLSNNGVYYSEILDWHTKDENILNDILYNSDTHIIKILCVFVNGELDLPPYYLRKRLCDLNTNNNYAEIMLKTKDGYHVRKLIETF